MRKPCVAAGAVLALPAAGAFVVDSEGVAGALALLGALTLLGGQVVVQIAVGLRVRRVGESLLAEVVVVTLLYWGSATAVLWPALVVGLRSLAPFPLGDLVGIGVGALVGSLTTAAVTGAVVVVVVKSSSLAGPRSRSEREPMPVA